MERSDDVRDAILRFYGRFSAGEPDGFANVIAIEPGVSVIGTDSPGLGARDRESWLAFYATQISPAGWTLRAGEGPFAYAEGTVGFGTDTPTAVGPDGSWVPTRFTAVLHQESDEWKIVHVHISVGVPDEDVIRPPD
jgi:ketosteroid isomerase-like protein